MGPVLMFQKREALSAECISAATAPVLASLLLIRYARSFRRHSKKKKIGAETILFPK